MSKWAINATNRIQSETVPGSSKFIIGELNESFSIASTAIENRYLHVRDDKNRLESWMKRVLQGSEKIDDLLGNASPEDVPPQSTLSKTSVQNFLPSPKSREVTIKIPVEAEDKIQNSTIVVERKNGGDMRDVLGEAPNTNKKVSTTQFNAPRPAQSTSNVRSSDAISKTDPFQKNKRATLAGNFGEVGHREVQPTSKTSPYTASSDAEDSFEAISAAIKRSVLVKKSELESKKEVSIVYQTPNRKSSKFVSLPTRTPLPFSKSANSVRREDSTDILPTVSIKNKLSPRRSPVKKNSPLPKLVKVPLRSEAVVIPATNTDTFQSSPAQVSNSEVKEEHDRSSASLWGKISEYRQLSPKKPPQSTPKHSPASKVIRSPKIHSPVRNSSPLRQRRSQYTSPLRVEIPPLKSPNLDRLAAPTASSAAKKKKPDSRKLENRFLTTTLQRTPRTFERSKNTKVVVEKAPKPQPKVDVQRSTKKSMMERRSEAAALKSRQKIVLNLRKSESKALRETASVVDDGEQAPTKSAPQTPVKFAPDNLPEVLSDDSHSPSSKVLQPWGRTPELYKIAKSKKKVDPSRIFHKSSRVNLSEVFNRNVHASQSPAPTPDIDKKSYLKSMGFS
ncbi:hypothetical protein CANMA_004581 [Candida margitis]|uniref:uncharacterized protein n=1 Tax=Candida margitis TaxID=1775924 RepID=UPI002225D722|nr:uncharacterized protein CANMA_004581 [Candida margitis]KAI5956152.1 hypothetical protein CANMA_004581 [Candida margitis]